MRNILSIVLCLSLFFVSCSSSKKSTENTLPEQQMANVEKVDKKTDKEKDAKELQKKKEKELKEKRKAQIKEQERLSKEAEAKKKAEAKAKKKAQKEQDDLIKNAEKAKKERIKEERRKEKEALAQAQKDLAKSKKTEEKIEEIVDETIEDEEVVVEEVVVGIEEKVVEAEKEAVEQEEQVSEKKELSTMEQVLSMMEKNPRDKSTTPVQEAENITENQEESVTAISDKEKKDIIKNADKDEKEGNIFKRTYRKIIPEKIDRDITYPSMYKEKPQTILILYPWNRSKYAEADEMLYVALTKELTYKGYYVLPALYMIDQYNKDTTKLSSQYTKVTDIKEYKEKYGVDAVMYVTIFRFEKPWWTTNINAVAHYTMISTSTMDTLFSRQADFNYDSQMPPKSNAKDKLVTDEKEAHYLGIMEQMQRYVLQDMPVGPHHIKYEQDQKKFSHKKEMKYKVKIKPS